MLLVIKLAHGELDGMAVGFVQIIDAFLIASGLLIFALGLYELFVGDIDLPAWLVIKDLDSLKAEAPAIGKVKAVEPWSPHLLARAWERLDGRVRSRVKRVSVPAFVRLEVALSGLIRTLTHQGRASFAGMLRGASRNDVVVHFMAVLELVRRRQATASQDALLGDITIQWVESGTEADRQSDDDSAVITA